MRSLVPFVDPHVHADSRSAEEYPRLKNAGCVGLVAVAGPGGGFSCPESLLDHFRRLDRVDRKRIEAAGLRAWIALGAHPDGIPEAGLDNFLDRWPQALRDHGAAAVGEIGLDKMTEDEERVLARGFQVAAEAGLPAIVHTPRQQKVLALERTLDLLGRSALQPQRVLLDHLDAETVEVAWSSGCWLGLSVHPAKLSPDQAARLVAERGPGHFVVDSDMGANPSHLFALPAVVSALRDLGVEEPAIQSVVHDHASDLMEMNT